LLFVLESLRWLREGDDVSDSSSALWVSAFVGYVIVSVTSDGESCSVRVIVGSGFIVKEGSLVLVGRNDIEALLINVLDRPLFDVVSERLCVATERDPTFEGERVPALAVLLSDSVRHVSDPDDRVAEDDMVAVSSSVHDVAVMTSVLCASLSMPLG
jgi:hypothetical protein